MLIKIDNIYIGNSNKCFVIAEAGVNHNGDIEKAYELIDAAVDANADAVKFQTFKTEEIATIDAKQATYQKINMGKEESQYEMLKRLELSYQNFKDLKKYCDKKNILFMSAPHSCKEDVDLVAALCPVIKVPSGDLTNLPILKYMAEKRIPIILSTGMSNMEEIKEALDIITPINKQLIILHCTSNYPTPLNEVNLKAMKTIEKAFGFPVGYSDHTMGTEITVASVAMGACVVEKHFTLDRNLPGPDHKASLEPNELKKMVNEIRNVEKRLTQGISPEKILKELNLLDSMGDGVKKPQLSEIEVMRVARKSLVAAVNIPEYTIITEKMLAIKRPGTGLHPRNYWSLIGKKAKTNIKKDEMLDIKMIA